MTETTEREKTAKFFEKIDSLVSSSSLLLALYVADRVKLLQRMDGMIPSTPTEISSKLKLEHRHLTELLSCLAAGGILTYSPNGNEEGRFHLPKEHSAVVSNENSALFQGGWFQMMKVLAGVTPSVAESLEGKKKGVHWDEYGEVGDAIKRINQPAIKSLLVKKWIPVVPGLVRRLEEGIKVADVGCGFGVATISMATAFPNSTFCGFDIDKESIEEARRASAGLKNISFEIKGAEETPSRSFDFVMTLDVIHDTTNPKECLRSIKQSLLPRGIYLMIEPSISPKLENNINMGAAKLYGISLMHCMTQSLARGGEGLGAAWGSEKAKRYSEEVGFRFEILPVKNPSQSFYMLTDASSKL